MFKKQIIKFKKWNEKRKLLKYLKRIQLLQSAMVTSCYIESTKYLYRWDLQISIKSKTYNYKNKTFRELKECILKQLEKSHKFMIEEWK